MGIKVFQQTLINMKFFSLKMQHQSWLISKQEKKENTNKAKQGHTQIKKLVNKTKDLCGAKWKIKHVKSHKNKILDAMKILRISKQQWQGDSVGTKELFN